MGDDKFQNQAQEYHKLIFEQDRLETFKKNWKELKGFKFCTPENFAAAGFYNFSSNSYFDNVKCFACEKQLSDWEKDDDPWKEHVKRGSTCPFVIFKSKEKTTFQDIFQLMYDINKNLLNSYFEQQKEVLHEKENLLMKTVNTLQKTRK